MNKKQFIQQFIRGCTPEVLERLGWFSISIDPDFSGTIEVKTLKANPARWEPGETFRLVLHKDD